MISRLKPPNVNVMSLTTIASPHRGSAFADYVFDRIGRELILAVGVEVHITYDEQQPTYRASTVSSALFGLIAMPSAN